MRVHVCDICRIVIEDANDRKVIKIRKNRPHLHLDFGTGFTDWYFETTKHELCPTCYDNLVTYLKQSVKIYDTR